MALHHSLEITPQRSLRSQLPEMPSSPLAPLQHSSSLSLPQKPHQNGSRPPTSSRTQRPRMRTSQCSAIRMVPLPVSKSAISTPTATGHVSTNLSSNAQLEMADTWVSTSPCPRSSHPTSRAASSTTHRTPPTCSPYWPRRCPPPPTRAPFSSRSSSPSAPASGRLCPPTRPRCSGSCSRAARPRTR